MWGLELGLFLNGMVDLQLDLFRRTPSQIYLCHVSLIPMTAGFMKQPWENYGKSDESRVQRLP